ncbi:MAG: hypothetical protein ACE5K9_02710 [Candidatus Methylomirabilales bacterium]
MADQQISTTVDSEITRYYLEEYLQNKRTNPAYDTHIDEILNMWENRALDSDTLKDVTTQFSPDFATLYLISRIYKNADNRKAQQAFHAYLEMLRRQSGKNRFHIFRKFTSYLIVFVPGYGYKQDPTTGADFALQRRIMNQAGFKTVLVETDEIGTIAKNAAILADELARLEKHYEKIILVSTSKAGPEVALTIGKLMAPEQLTHVKAWVSIGGLLRGSPIADQAWTWPKRWLTTIAFFFEGLNTDVVKDLRTDKRKEIFAQLHFPENILLIQYVGAPLSGHIGEHVEGRYNDMRNDGPNDGLTLLADEIIEGSIVITDIGLDHFYLDREIDLKTLALAHVVFEKLQRRKHRLDSRMESLHR